MPRLLWCLLALATPALAADLTVTSGPLRAEITLDPWQIQFVDDTRGVVLTEGDATAAGAFGSLGFRTADGWTHALRGSAPVREQGAVTVHLDTTGAAPRPMTVTIAPAALGVIAVEARLDQPANDVTALGTGWHLAPDERLLGFGERSNAVDQRGNVLENWSAEGPFQPDERSFVGSLVPLAAARTRDDSTYFPMPWLLSTRGYGFLVDNSEVSYHRLGSDVPDRWSVEVAGLPDGLGAHAAPDSLRFRVFAGPTPADVLQRFTAAMGRQPQPAAPWVLGPWFQATGALEVRQAQVQKLRAADAPLSVVQTYTHYLPCGSHIGREVPERMLTAAMHDLGAAITTYFNPMICTSHPRFPDAAGRRALTRTATGAPYIYNYIASQVFQVGQVDFSTRTGVRFYGELLQEAVDNGYDGWMEDFGEYTPVDSFTADGRDGAVTHNRYPVDYHCGAWDFVRKQHRPVVRFQRSGWTGVQPCAQVVWNGDPSTTWDFDGLASAVRNGINMGLSGVAVWGSDIGGFHAFLDRALTPEMLTRWVQFGAVSGVMRTQRDGVAIPAKVRPQVEDDDQIANWRRYAKLRTQLYPYIDAAVREYRRSGMPVMRHLVLEAPDDPLAAGVDDAFLFGPDVLAAPVLTPGATERSVYAPAGTWLDFWRTVAYDAGSGGFSLGAAALHEGGRAITLPAPLDELPLLIRAGAVLPLLPADVDTLAEYGTGLVHLSDRRDRLHLLAFPRGTTRRAYGQRGQLRSVERPGRWDLAIRGGEVRSVELEASLATLNTPFVPCTVRWRGRELPADQWSYDPATAVLRAHLDGSPSRLSARACVVLPATP